MFQIVFKAFPELISLSRVLLINAAQYEEILDAFRVVMWEELFPMMKSYKFRLRLHINDYPDLYRI